MSTAQRSRSSSPPSRDLVGTLFLANGDLYQCKLCPITRKQAVGSGYSNLMDHLRRAHLEGFSVSTRS
ncbi:TPA: hypothetical protein N0F65_000962 [Lagenidium giganteum]|uniref:BED-type domain-containing protein n=1 Tax=Lagenidium giganteum TaxID=4803 RepID=A0AAV2YWW0_9STRA|nr:TPA: hypothetical protein N0F65_000962 [Lagenidium giganteum]